MHRIAVIGLGRFGMVLARKLAASGAEVIAIDRNATLINEIMDDVDVAVRMDSTDRDALASQDIDKVDTCVIAIGENFEAALLTTVIVKQLGVPRIICRAQTEFHAEIFRQVGATEVIQPENQAGEQLARKLANPQIEDFITLAEGYTLVEMLAPREFHNKSIKVLNLRAKYGVNLVAIKRAAADAPVDKPRDVISVPKPEDLIQPNDVLVIAASDKDLAQLPRE